MAGVAWYAGLLAGVGWALEPYASPRSGRGHPAAVRAVKAGGVSDSLRQDSPRPLRKLAVPDR